MNNPSNSLPSQQPDNREWLTCPVCRKPARPLNPAPGQTLNPDPGRALSRCQDCKVTFFDKGEFARNLGDGVEPQNFPMAFAPAGFKEQLQCPRCAKPGSSAKPALPVATPLTGH